MSPKIQKLTVDLVIPIFNEVDVIAETHAHICTIIDSMPYNFTFYYVDDGSDDGTLDSLKALEDTRINVLELSRNFGHQAALTAGMDVTQGDIVITMDGDGQHPPHMIPELLALITQGYDIVQTQRMDESQPASFKKWTSRLFYRLINSISGTSILPGAADFRAMSRQAVDAINPCLSIIAFCEVWSHGSDFQRSSCPISLRNGCGVSQNILFPKCSGWQWMQFFHSP